MKKLLLSLFSLTVFAVASNAQSADTKVAPVSAQDKEAKAKMKQKNAEDLEAALKEAGITDELAIKFKDIQKEFAGRSSEVKKNSDLADAAKEEQLKTINSEKNQKLSDLVGVDKYKLYNAARKRQKEANASVAK